MNAVEIEQAISDLALQPFDAAEFPFAFLAAFGNKDTTLRRLRAGNNNASDVPGGVLQRKIKLLNLRKRMARIRVFDPACGSGNLLVIAYKQTREIEAEINRRRSEMHLRSETPLTNFRGVELRDFPAEIARLALIIAEFLCNVLYRGQKDALAELLPLDAGDWVVCGNALRLDWLSTCPPTGTGVKVLGDDLFATPLEQTEIDFENEGGETCVCGNPPHLGSRDQQDKQKSDLQLLFDKRGQNWKSLDFVAGWFMKAADYAIKTQSSRAASSAKSFARLNLFATCALLLVDRGSVLDRGANYRSHRATNWRRASSSAQWRDDCGGHRREFSPVSTDVGI